jgi:hypothetical protein
MDRFVTRSEAERRDIFQEAAAQRNLLPIVFEKDFWVCWTLKNCSNRPSWLFILLSRVGRLYPKRMG